MINNNSSEINDEFSVIKENIFLPISAEKQINDESLNTLVNEYL